MKFFEERGFLERKMLKKLESYVKKLIGNLMG